MMRWLVRLGLLTPVFGGALPTLLDQQAVVLGAGLGLGQRAGARFGLRPLVFALVEQALQALLLGPRLLLLLRRAGVFSLDDTAIGAAGLVAVGVAAAPDWGRRGGRLCPGRADAQAQHQRQTQQGRPTRAATRRAARDVFVGHGVAFPLGADLAVACSRCMARSNSPVSRSGKTSRAASSACSIRRNSDCGGLPSTKPTTAARSPG